MDRRAFLASSAVAPLVAGGVAASAIDADITWLPAWQIREAIVSGKITALAVTDHFLSRIARLDPQLHAFRAIDVAGAREQARNADAALARGEKPGLLHGVPMAVKENVATRGFPSPAQGHRPGDVASIDMTPVPEDSIIAERLRKAGAIILGVTVMPGMGIAVGMPDLAHHPRNPWNPEKVPGSSSAGSAAAVAAGMVPIAIGGDGGGCRGGQDPAAEPLAHQTGQVAGVVEVGVGDDDGVDARRVDGQRFPIEFAEVLDALEQSAVHQDSRAAGLQEMFGAGDRAGCAQAAQSQCLSVPRTHAGSIGA